MILPSLILVLIVGGIASWIAARRSAVVARWIALISTLVDATGLCIFYSVAIVLLIKLATP